MFARPPGNTIAIRPLRIVRSVGDRGDQAGPHEHEHAGLSGTGKGVGRGRAPHEHPQASADGGPDDTLWACAAPPPS